MREFVIGLDCGTSYLKATIMDSDGFIVGAIRSRSPVISSSRIAPAFPPASWWAGVSNALRRVSATVDWSAWHLVAVCVSSISPVLTVFDQDDPANGFALPYWYLASIDRGTVGGARTRMRMEFLARDPSMAQLHRPAVTDLVGYLNYWLAGRLCTNTLAIGELGLRGPSEIEDVLRVAGSPPPTVGAPAQCCGRLTAEAARQTDLPVGTPICYGSSDSFASALGSGMDGTGRMIHLGTFGSLLEVYEPVDSIAQQVSDFVTPYKFLLSVPHFGPTIERVAESLFPEAGGIKERLHRMDVGASRVSLGADGFLFLLPTCDSIGLEQGQPRLHVPRNGATATTGRMSRAVLESLGYAIRALTPLGEAEADGIWVGGGGANSELWLQILADVLDTRLLVREGVNNASGTAEIAARSLGQGRTVRRAGARVLEPRHSSARAVHDNVQLATATYRAL